MITAVPIRSSWAVSLRPRSPVRQACAALTAACVFAASLLLRFPPDESSFYPACPFHALTGLRCPGCGATRALAALLHGQLRQALHWNAFFVLLVLPLAWLYLFTALREDRWPAIRKPALTALIIAAAGFALFRNL